MRFMMRINNLSNRFKIVICLLIFIIITILIFIYKKQQYRKTKSANYYHLYKWNDIYYFKTNIKFIFTILTNHKFPINNEELISLWISEIKNDEYYYITEDRFRKYFERYKYFSFEKDKKFIYILEYNNKFDDIYIEEQHNMRIAWDDKFQIVPEECGEILIREKGFWKDKYYKEPITEKTFPNFFEVPVRIKETVK